MCQMICSWVRKVLCIANAHKCLGAVQGAVASAALVAGVSLASILQAGDWARVTTPATHYFSIYITAVDQHKDSMQHAVLGFSK